MKTLPQLSAATALTLAILAAAGCGGVNFLPSPTNLLSSAGLAGTLRGGQQPVSGAKVYLYAVSTAATAGPATSLLGAPGYVVTDAAGNFSITSNYTCPAGAFVYLLALGGNPGLAPGTSNPALALAAGLGACTSLTPSSFYNINEVSTVAAAYSFAPFAASETRIGSTSPSAITAAFANIANLINPAQGSALAQTAGGNGVVPQAKIDSLADALAPCVNSSGTGSPCASLFSAANVISGSSTPVDTFQAALNIAGNPTVNVASIFNLSAPASPFQPALSSAPADWTVAVQYPVGSVTLSPAAASISQISPQVFTASLSGVAGSNFSYLWTTPAAAGTLTEVGGAGRNGQTSFCSSNAQVNYVPNAAQTLSSNVADRVTVQVFSGNGCASGSGLASANATVTVLLPLVNTVIPNVPIATYTGAVTLPSGSTVTPDALTVLDSLTQTSPLPSGTFSIPRYNTGEQVALVLSPRGTPMMMGWLDAAHPAITAGTTAEVFAYMALGGSQMLTEADRNRMIAGISALPGLPALTAAISAELAANPDAFAQPDAAVTAALNALFTSVTGVTPRGHGLPGLHANDLTVSPSPGAPQSGVSVSAVPPPAPYYTNSVQDADSTYITNAYRRRTHAFVGSVKDTFAGTDQQDLSPVADFDVPPTTGVNGGVTGAISDIFKAYFGNQPYAYSPVTTDPFELPVKNGADSTTYQIINVGPGGSGVARPVVLTPAQQTQLIATSVNGIVTDAIVPFFTNVLFGSGSFKDNSNNAVIGSVGSKFSNELGKNLLNILGGLLSTQDKIVGGDFKGAVGDLLVTTGGLPVIGTIVESSAKAALNSAGYNPASFTTAFTKFNTLLYAAGGVLQIFDTVIYSAQVLGSDNVDAWTVKGTPTKAKLSPGASTLNGLGAVTLTVLVPQANSTAGFSYHWTVSPAAGQSLVGSLSEVGGGNRSNLTDFCSSSNIVSYINNSAAVTALTDLATDTVSVQVFGNGSVCSSGKPLTNTVAATVTTNPLPTAIVNPSASTINPGDTVQFTASYSDKNTTPVSWMWVLAASTGSTTYGTLSGQGGTNSFCSTSPNATYTSTAVSPFASTAVDIVGVTAYNAAGCTIQGELRGPASASVTTSSSFRLRITPTSSIHAGDQIALTAAFKLGLAGMPTPGSYRWSTTGTFGTLMDNKGVPNQTNFCSVSNQATYVSNASPMPTQVEVEKIYATPFDDANCTPAQVDGLQGTASIDIDPPLGPFTSPGAISNVVQSGDGNFYATASSTACSPSSTDHCDYILKITPSGTISALHTFQQTTDSNINPSGINDDGAYVNSLLEASDGNLYGTAGVGGSSGKGTIFKITKSGNFTLLYSFDNVFAGVTVGYGTSYQCSRGPFFNANYAAPNGVNPGPIIEGADGNFYGIAHGGVGIGGGADGVFFQISPNGGFRVLRTYQYAYSYLTKAPLDRGCGAQYAQRLVDPVYFRDYYAAPALLQGTDLAFYVPMTDSNLPSIARLDDSGTPSVVHSFSQSEGAPNGNAFIGGPNGLIFGMGSNGDFNFIPSGSFQLFPSTFSPLTVLGSDGNFYGAITTAYNTTGAIVQTTPSGAVTTVAQVTDTAPNAPVMTGVPAGNFIEAANGNLVGGALYTDPYKAPAVADTDFLFNLPLTPALTGPIHLSFPTATAPVNRPITLTWIVSNAFSATAQMCHATIQGANASGAGNWTGPQPGVLNGMLYTGGTTIVPTAPGNYTYALTCGGKQSGFTTLTVQ